jgi:hypothetical protein
MLTRLEQEAFFLNMKDHWTSDDFLENSRMQNEIFRLRSLEQRPTGLTNAF